MGTTHWILQVHYNDASGKNVGQTDNSGYDLCTTDKLRPNDAAVMAPGTVEQLHRPDRDVGREHRRRDALRFSLVLPGGHLAVVVVDDAEHVRVVQPDSALATRP